MHFHFQVAIRKQEVEDRLNSWIVFNEKNKELCAWLVQMENKVLQTADLSIEEMIEKLQKVSRNTQMDGRRVLCLHSQVRGGVTY